MAGLKCQNQNSRLNVQNQQYCLGSSVPDATLTVDVSSCLFDGAFRDEGWILCIAGYHQGFTSSPLSWGGKETDRTWLNDSDRSSQTSIARGVIMHQCSAERDAPGIHGIFCITCENLIIRVYHVFLVHATGGRQKSSLLVLSSSL